MFEILGEEFNLTYTLVLVSLVMAAYWFLFKPPQIQKTHTVRAPIPEIIKPPPPNPVEVIPPDTKGKIKILFGTQTGTAEDFSRTLAKEAKRYHIYAKVVDMELYDHSELQNEPYVILITSTHGEGEPPDNAKPLYKFLGSGLAPDLFAKVNYSVFGLGNKTYEHYNAVGRYMDAKMKETGAKEFFPRGEGDDDCSLEEDFNKWKKNLWPALCRHMGLDTTADSKLVDEKFIPRFKVATCPSSAAGKFSTRGGVKKAHTDGSPIYDMKNPYLATVTVNRELHKSSSDRSCRHLELEIGTNLQYQAGDHLGIYPKNSSVLVEQLAARLGSDLDQVIAIIPVESTLPSKLETDSELNKAAEEAALGPSTLRQILTEAIDITTPPRKTVLKALSEYAKDQKEKAHLLLLAKDAEADGNDEYSKWIKHDHRSIFEVLAHFPSVSPPLPVLLELLPRLAARFYSISSSPNAHPGYVHITSVVVRFHTPAGREHLGVCSTWLADLQPGTRVPVFIRESVFKLPPTPAPVIMVGPGTGLAPFRGFLQELKHRKKQPSQQDWESALFFGCRHRNHDYIYEEELSGYEGDNTLSHLHVAFSREQGNKVYVQDKLDEPQTRERVWNFLKKGGYFYVCGDARHMAKAVHQSLVKTVKECGKMSEAEANTYVDNLQHSGHYLQDVWF
jgi:NADPH-ferrihemoprotein reductase